MTILFNNNDINLNNENIIFDDKVNVYKKYIIFFIKKLGN